MTNPHKRAATPPLPDSTTEIPYGYCHCGCGRKTRVLDKNDRIRKSLWGIPLRFVNGHNAPRAEPLDSRFWKKVVKSDDPDGCWLWIGSRSVRGGYGMINVGKKHIVKAHRLSYEMRYGPIPHGYFILHKCDTPSCVNPDHLFCGDHDANMKDMVKKGRQAKGEGSGVAKLTESDVIEIRDLRKRGVSCREISVLFGIGYSTAYFVVTRRHWGHVK
jgi:hypothetical protein